MPWTPCTLCHAIPCTCVTWPGVNPVWPNVNPQPAYMPAGNTSTFSWPLVQRLSDEDIEKIAKRVVELLKESHDRTP